MAGQDHRVHRGHARPDAGSKFGAPSLREDGGAQPKRRVVGALDRLVHRRHPGDHDGGAEGFLGHRQRIVGYVHQHGRPDHPFAHGARPAQQRPAALVERIGDVTGDDADLFGHGDRADLAVDAVLRLKGSTNLSYIQVIKKLGGSIKESFLCDGLILEKTISTGCKRSLKNCKILASNTPMDYDKVKIYGTRVRVESL